MEESQFIASQIADFATNKSLFHRFLEEVSDKKVLAQQSSKESFVLVQIMVKAGMQLLETTESLVDHENESLLSRSLDAISFVIQQHREILLWTLQTPSDAVTEYLWCWLISQLQSLLASDLSPRVSHNVVTALASVLHELQQNHESRDTPKLAKQKILGALLAGTRNPKVYAQLSCRQALLQLRLFLILVKAYSVEDELDSCTREPLFLLWLMSEIRSFLSQLDMLSPLWTTTQKAVYTNLVLQVVGKTSSLRSLSIWVIVAEHSLKLLLLFSVSHEFMVTMSSYYEDFQIDTEIVNILKQLIILPASCHTTVLTRCVAYSRRLGELLVLPFSVEVRTHLNILGDKISPEIDGPTHKNAKVLAPIFEKKTGITKSVHLLTSALAELLLDDSLTLEPDHLIEHISLNFGSLRPMQQHLALHAIGLTACAMSGHLYHLEYSRKDHLKFACSSCDQLTVCNVVLATLEPLKTNLIQRLLKITKQLQSTSGIDIHVELLNSWRRCLRHTQDHNSFVLEESLRYINTCLEDDARRIRVYAGLLLVEYFRYGTSETEEHVFLANRRRVFDVLRRLRSMTKHSESLIKTWAELGCAAKPDDLQLILLTLVDYLCDSNMFVRQSAVSAIHTLASRMGQSVYMLFSPYMRHISIQVLDRSQKHRDFIMSFSHLLGISAADFLSRNQQYLMPPMVLHGLQEPISMIAQHTKRDRKQAVLDNMPYILSSLLTSGYIKDGGLTRFLTAIDDSFATIALDELVNSYPIPLAVELLQLFADSSAKRENVQAALSQVALICSKVNSGTRKTPRDMASENLRSFLQKHSLGIVSQCEESMNGFHGKRSFLDRTRYVAAIGELIVLIQQGVEHAVPQITAILQTATDEPGLRLAALEAWQKLISTVSTEVVSNLITYTFCLFQSIWDICTEFEKACIRKIISCFFDIHQVDWRKHIDHIPILRIAELQAVEKKLEPYRTRASLPSTLRALNDLVINNNPVICEEGLRALQVVLLARQSELYSIVLRDWKGPILHDTLRNLLDVTIKFRSTQLQIPLLASECLGIIGAVDPVRQDGAKHVHREVILHNFEDQDAEESVKFVRIFLESQLIDAFRTATRSNIQIFLAWAIQELLKFSGLNDSVLMLSNDRNYVHSAEAKQRWLMFTPQAREVMTPLLSSKYDAGTRISKGQSQYPIISHTTNYNAWLYSFLMDLLQSAVGENARKLFSVFLRILREEETVISSFLLPYVFLNILITSGDEKRCALMLEIITVLQHRNTTDMHQTEFARLSMESIFSVIDYLSLWTRARKIYNRDRLADKLKRQNRHIFAEDEQDKDTVIKEAQDFVHQIPSKLMADAALYCGSYSRALFYWEQHIRSQSVKKLKERELEPLYAHLQQLYMHINDPDGIEGISTSLTDLTLDQEIMMHENAGRWTSAQNTYEMALRTFPDRADLQVGLLNCLKQTGHHEVLLDQATRFLQESNIKKQAVLDMAIESSWTLDSWRITRDLVSQSEERTYDVLLSQSLLDYRAKDEKAFARSVVELKLRVMNDLVQSNLDSTWQCHDSLAKLSVIHELEYHAKPRLGTSTGELTPTILRDRLLIMPTRSRWKQHILAIRRTLLSQDPIDNRAKSISTIWLESAKLARKAGQSQQAYKAILHALTLDGTPLAKIEHARWWWKEGHQIRAIQTLKKALDSGVLETYEPDAHNSISSVDASMLNTGRTPKAALISKAELLLTRWNDLAEHANSLQQKQEYSEASKGSQLEKPHYFLGRFYLRLLKAETVKRPELQDAEYLDGLYHRQITLCFGRAMHFGTKYIFQTLPSFLQLWLDFGAELRFFHARVVLTNAKKQELTQKRAMSLQYMNGKMSAFVDRLPAYLFMLAFPQILSRINHSEESCYNNLKSMILKCLQAYPKQSLWPFMAIIRSRDSSRSTRGSTILADLTKSDNKTLLLLIKDAKSLTNSLMRVCTVPVIKNRATLSLSRDLEFDMKIAPSNLVIPIQNNLTVVLPSHAGNGSTKHHRAFEENQPSISSFKDEVEVMASLQKPRKITIRASDGQAYPFLVKPNDDLRKDARLMDFNSVIQKFIRKDPDALKRLLKIRTYAVIPLNEEHGLCEWVKNTRPLRDILVKTYASRNIAMQYTQVKQRLEECLVSEAPGEAFKLHVLQMFPPTFHDWFVEKFADPAQWFSARLSYSRTLAVMSMVGFVLGLGDRHGENILFDETTGDAVHVDFNCLFEKGHTFDKPERVPFRLTHNMVDAMGITGVEGSFRRTCEITLRILRLNQDAFNTVLESFLHDPVAEFIKKAKKSQTGDFEKSEAMKVLSVIANKLKGSAGAGIADKHTPLSIEGQADELIKQATDPALLVQMYVGWTAWL